MKATARQSAGMRVLMQLGMIGPALCALAFIATGVRGAPVLLIPVALGFAASPLFLVWFYVAHRRRLAVCAAQTVVFALLVASVVSGICTGWPVRAAFAVSRPALQRLADRVERHEKVQFPVRAGVFTIYHADRSGCVGTSVTLYTSARAHASLFCRYEGFTTESAEWSGNYLTFGGDTPLNFD